MATVDSGEGVDDSPLTSEESKTAALARSWTTARIPLIDQGECQKTYQFLSWASYDTLCN